MSPLVLAILNLLNELVTGPCEINQQTLMSKPILELYQIMTRLPDDLSHDYFQLKEASLNLVFSLTEGFNKKFMREIAVRVTPSILQNQIERLVKKQYIHELLKDNEYRNKVRETLEHKMRKRMLENGVRKLKESFGKELPDPTQADFLAKGKTIQNAGVQGYDENSYSMVTQEMEASVEITDWNTLFDMYLKREGFCDHFALRLVFRFIIIWKVLTDFSKKHALSYSDIERESKLAADQSNFLFISQGQSEASETSSIFYFLQQITLNIEIVDPLQSHQLVYFPKRPECFLLATEDKKSYLDVCSILDSSTKMIGLMRNFNLFAIQMETNL